jgi:uncharacterized membrane protein SirB2
MSDQPAARAPQSADGHGGLRLLALAAVALGVLLLAAAAFVLSYAGIHAVALAAGVSPRLARIYPLIFDAMLVVAGAAVLALRSAGLPSRSYAWLSMLALLAAAAAADALHATGTRLPRRPAAATAAVIPWALVLIGFGLLLCMLRQARLRRAAAAGARRDVAPGPSGHVTVRHAVLSPPGPDAAADGDGASGPVPPPASPAADLVPDLAIDAEPGPDDPASDEAVPGADRVPRAREEQPAGYGDRAASVFSPAPTPALADDSITKTRPVAVDAGPGSGADDAGHSGVGTRPAAESGSGDGAEFEAKAGPGVQAQPEAAAEPAVEAANDAAVEPASAPTAPQFDRMRSSPIPPDA